MAQLSWHILTFLLMIFLPFPFFIFNFWVPWVLLKYILLTKWSLECGNQGSHPPLASPPSPPEHLTAPPEEIIIRFSGNPYTMFSRLHSSLFPLSSSVQFHFPYLSNHLVLKFPPLITPNLPLRHSYSIHLSLWNLCLYFFHHEYFLSPDCVASSTRQGVHLL